MTHKGYKHRLSTIWQWLNGGTNWDGETVQITDRSNSDWHITDDEIAAKEIYVPQVMINRWFIWVAVVPV